MLAISKAPPPPHSPKQTVYWYSFCAQDNHFRPAASAACLLCDCYAVGSFSRACDRDSGQCPCKPGVIGRQCDRCDNPFAEVSSSGCEGQTLKHTLIRLSCIPQSLSNTCVCVCVCVCVCSVIYDSCPQAIEAGIWWPRTKFGLPAAISCPKGSMGTKETFHTHHHYYLNNAHFIRLWLYFNVTHTYYYNNK